jgi:hypothetical protein
MAIGKNIEITAESEQGFEDAICQGIERTAKKVEDIQSAWVKEMKVEVQDGKVSRYRVDMKVTFLVHD